MSNVLHSIEELVGHTPLVELERYEKIYGYHAHLLAKLECFNPSGSIKDRASLEMINAAEGAGLIHPGDTIVEQTSGNTGIALAAFAIPRGYQVKIFLEKGVSMERRRILEAYGVKLLDYRDALGISKAERESKLWKEPEREATLKEIAAYCKNQPQNHYFINQVFNENNPQTHVRTTGPELWEDTDGKIDALVCMAGTGGTALGLSSYLKKQNPDVKIVLVQPAVEERDSKDIIDGVLPFAGVVKEDVTEFMNYVDYDECISVTTEAAFQIARTLVRTEGLLMGTSSAAALCAASQLAQRMDYAGKNIVIIMPDNGMKYLSTHLY